MNDKKLLGGQELLEALFDANCRPSIWWLRDQRKARKLPYIKMGRRIFYDLDEVRKVLHEKWKIKSLE